VSYNVYVYIPAAVDPDEEAVCWEGNYTSNAAAMWHRAIGVLGLGDVIDTLGQRAEHLIPELARAIDRMRDNPDDYRELEPENGWGDYEGALAFLEGIERACRNYPMARVRASR
jgi:hypothetical protein